MLKFEIPLPCPSIQSKSVAAEIKKWREYILAQSVNEGVIKNDFDSPEEGIRQVVRQTLNGPCKLKETFFFKRTKTNIPDLDNMGNFVAACFKTEQSFDSRQMAKDIDRAGFIPWFYYTLFEYPYDMDIWAWEAKKITGAREDKTQIIIERFN